MLDIGANIGYYSLLAAKLGQQVVAVEPVLDSIERLQHAAQLDDVTERITVVYNGVADVRTKATLRQSGGNQGDSRIELQVTSAGYVLVSRLGGFISSSSVVGLPASVCCSHFECNIYLYFPPVSRIAEKVMRYTHSILMAGLAAVLILPKQNFTIIAQVFYRLEPLPVTVIHSVKTHSMHGRTPAKESRSQASSFVC